MKLCECGCGMPAPLASKTETKRGRVKGCPLRFVHGHHRRGTRLYSSVVDVLLVRARLVGECLVLPTSSVREYAKVFVDGKLQPAHRIVYELCFSEIPDGFEVCHKCDVRACIAPDHLFLGTHTKNMRDMTAKDRAAAAKLTAVKVREIRSSTATIAQLAKTYGVDPHTAWRARNGRSWKDV